MVVKILLGHRLQEGGNDALRIQESSFRVSSDVLISSSDGRWVICTFDYLYY